MSAFKTLLAFTLLSVVSARFGQENAAQGVIAALGGGQAATLGGQSISTLLAGSNACDKLRLADQVAQLEGAGAIDAAKILVQAEKNFNPFAVDRPNICDDAGLPATPELRGIIPLIDPAVEGSAAVNAASAASLQNPLTQNGSQAQLLEGLGFITFNAQNSAGVLRVPAAGAGAGAGDNVDEVDDEVEELICPPGTIADPNAGAGAGVGAGAGAGAGTGADTGVDAGAQGNLQTFRGNIGAAIDAIVFSGNAARPFQVAGSTFVNFAAAAARTCDRQFNACANAANAGADDFEFADCTTQKDDCTRTQAAARVTSFNIKRRSVIEREAKMKRRALKA